jgi:hypothetical protein
MEQTAFLCMPKTTEPQRELPPFGHAGTHVEQRRCLLWTGVAQAQADKGRPRPITILRSVLRRLHFLFWRMHFFERLQLRQDIQVFVPARGPFRTDGGIERSHSILAAKRRHGDGVDCDSRELAQTGQVTKQISVA